VPDLGAAERVVGDLPCRATASGDRCEIERVVDPHRRSAFQM
jgi:hypothetical protein